MPKNAKKLEFQPYVWTQKVVGHEDWGGVAVNTCRMIATQKHSLILQTKNCSGKFVHTLSLEPTELSSALALPMLAAKVSSSEDGTSANPSEFRARSASANEVIATDSDVVHLARTLDAKRSNCSLLDLDA